MSNVDLFTGQTKDEISIQRLKDFEPKEGYYVAFSGGKDSVVLLDIVKRSGVKFDAHYNITGIDPPELYYFIRDNFPEVQRHRTDTTIWKLIVKKMMPPTRLVRYCCAELKERGGKDRRVVTGIRWAESNRRGKRSPVEECFKDKHKVYVHPIIDWSDEDIWEYIKTRDIKYCSLYDEGFKRLGCIGCPMAGDGRIKEFKRWPKFKEKYRTAFAAAAAAANIAALGTEYGGYNRDAKLRWKDGEEMFEWWMQDKHPKKQADQTIMFE
ncbi:MAG: phosphoadenosine phosphosulfate reductase family protein [Candidatus Paceibacterota bacterium]|jgi:phosphoadenosine phosphosulfate reductase